MPGRLDRESSRSRARAYSAIPSGIYNVTFDRPVWKSVGVESGKRTVLVPGILMIENPDFSHEILDSETGEVVEEVNSSFPRATLIPSTVDVTCPGGAVWREVAVVSGKTTVFKAGVIRVKGANVTVHDAEGNKLGSLSGVRSRVSLPPGVYRVRVAGQEVPVKLTKGKTVYIELE